MAKDFKHIVQRISDEQKEQKPGQSSLSTQEQILRLWLLDTKDELTELSKGIDNLILEEQNTSIKLEKAKSKTRAISTKDDKEISAWMKKHRELAIQSELIMRLVSNA